MFESSKHLLTVQAIIDNPFQKFFALILIFGMIHIWEGVP